MKERTSKICGCTEMFNPPIRFGQTADGVQEEGVQGGGTKSARSRRYRTPADSLGPLRREKRSQEGWECRASRKISGDVRQFFHRPFPEAEFWSCSTFDIVAPSSVSHKLGSSGRRVERRDDGNSRQ